MPRRSWLGHREDRSAIASPAKFGRRRRWQSNNAAGADGVAISIIVSEVDSVGGFLGASFSEPALNGGILLGIFGYMT